MSEYYLIVRKGAGPMFELSSEDREQLAPRVCYPYQPLKIYETFKPEDDYVIPEFMELPRLALSTRIVKEAGLEYLYGINLVRGNLTNQRINRDYYFFVGLCEFKCVDLDKSENDDGVLWGLEKLVLDDALIATIPLQQRLIFKMAEDNTFLFHKSVVERIMATNPINLTFIPSTQYTM